MPNATTPRTLSIRGELSYSTDAPYPTIDNATYHVFVAEGDSIVTGLRHASLSDTARLAAAHGFDTATISDAIECALVKGQKRHLRAQAIADRTVSATP